eukprot:CAMPEP_0170517718 /NCGR_PEP_ID=MMETSP0209-20121228/3613_1 /TAXON_ID=665100 ORGANISM="Litonotus pictus, Strain P1" /NCGR_SAMPLE_ID=MMETSP0209 /ASSEMBLY_ACC=CAM_ASM_000301 /LENGTH=59 /DNA_ID=CAMNT_0010803041 /DNA_START=323 /DNA_END=499 /DNA_ORIENTATION=-
MSDLVINDFEPETIFRSMGVDLEKENLNISSEFIEPKLEIEVDRMVLENSDVPVIESIT